MRVRHVVGALGGRPGFRRRADPGARGRCRCAASMRGTRSPCFRSSTVRPASSAATTTTARQAVLGLIAELHLATTAAGSGVRTAGLGVPGRHHRRVGAAAGRRAMDRRPVLGARTRGGPRLPGRAGRAARARRPALRGRADPRGELGRHPRRAARRQRHPDERRHAARRLGHRCDRSARARSVDARRSWRPWRALRPGDRPAQINEAALDFFRLAWDLGDLSEYLNVLRSPHQENDDTLRQIPVGGGLRARSGSAGPRCSTPADRAR